MPIENNRTRLGALDRFALQAAQRHGWLTLAPGMGDTAVTRWQQKCCRSLAPFAVLRIEAQRASLWLILPPGREWTLAGQRRVRAAMTRAISFVMTGASTRAILPRGDHTRLMSQLLAAETAGKTGLLAAPLVG